MAYLCGFLPPSLQFDAFFHFDRVWQKGNCLAPRICRSNNLLWQDDFKGPQDTSGSFFLIGVSPNETKFDAKLTPLSSIKHWRISIALPERAWKSNDGPFKRTFKIRLIAENSWYFPLIFKFKISLWNELSINSIQ